MRLVGRALEEDLDRAADSYQNAHRLSIEWSRVQPTPDRWDEDALDRYRQILRGMAERNLVPMVTLHHFSDPLWLAEQGGWEDEAVVTRFEAYVRKVVEALREYTNLWVTINEPNTMYALGYVTGVFPPGKSDLKAALQVVLNQARAHAAAYHAIHSLQPTARVGLSVQYLGFAPYREWLPLDRLAAGLQKTFFNDLFPRLLAHGEFSLAGYRLRVPEARGTQDFFGFNYYTRYTVAFDPRLAGQMFGRRFFLPGADLSDNGWLANVPQGFFQALRWALQFKLPIIITENGVENADDQLRPRYLIQHLHQLWRGVNFNFPVKGYFHWTLVDNFEWERGWTQRFGLWELDPATQVRRKRPSADLYAEICKENGISSEMVARYAPEIFAKMFPN